MLILPLRTALKNSSSSFVWRLTDISNKVIDNLKVRLERAGMRKKQHGKKDGEFYKWVIFFFRADNDYGSGECQMFGISQLAVVVLGNPEVRSCVTHSVKQVFFLLEEHYKAYKSQSKNIFKIMTCLT